MRYRLKRSKKQVVIEARLWLHEWGHARRVFQETHSKVMPCKYFKLTLDNINAV